jgi:leucine-rich repeat protein SHOC2
LTKCTQLTQVDLAHNSLGRLPDRLGALKGLKKLSVKYNQLRHLPVSLAQCGAIEYLNVENNLLDSIEQAVFDALVNARIVILSRNRLTSLPCMDALVYLDSFAAEYNQIDALDERVFALNERLGSFWGLNNHFIRSTFDFVLIPCLKASLNLKSNHIGSLPPDLSVWSHIKEINLSSNRLTTIPESIGSLHSVVELRLSNNKISELPDQIGALKELKVLELDENELTYISNYIGECNQLTKLILTSNRISSLPTDIGDLAILTHLYIGENRIFSIPPHIGKMASLKELYINDNADLQNLPLELSYCKSLQILSIEGCPLGDIPSDFQVLIKILIIFLKLIIYHSMARRT